MIDLSNHITAYEWRESKKDTSYHWSSCGKILYVHAAILVDTLQQKEVKDKEAFVLCCDGGEISLTNAGNKYHLHTYYQHFGTLNEIPKNVKALYMTNLNCHGENFYCLPCGYLANRPMDKVIEQEKTRLLYVNFRNTIPERVNIKFLADNFWYRWATVRWPHEVETQEELVDYLQNLQKHKFCICPPGCGLDSYRVWECLYNSCIPVMKKSIFTSYLAEWLPIVEVDDYSIISKEYLEQWTMISQNFNNLNRLNRTWWLDHIQNSASKINGQ